jgi:hypothetical protein
MSIAKQFWNPKVHDSKKKPKALAAVKKLQADAKAISFF